MSSSRTHTRVSSLGSNISSMRPANQQNRKLSQIVPISEDLPAPNIDAADFNTPHQFTRKSLTVNNKKGKKLSEKGKYKLADARARQMLDEWHQKQQSMLNELSPQNDIRSHRISSIKRDNIDILNSRHSVIYENPNAFNLTGNDFAPLSPVKSPRSPMSDYSDTDYQSDYNDTTQFNNAQYDDTQQYNDMESITEEIHVWDDVELNDSERLELMRQYCMQQIDTEEAKRRIQKHQRKLNELRNASKANQKIKDFDWQQEEQKWLDKYTNFNMDDEQPIIISEPVHVISVLLESVLTSQTALITLLQSEEIQYELCNTDIRILHASLDASFNGRRSPLNFRVEMLWRFASTIQDTYISLNRKLLLQLAIYSYHLLIEKCDIQKHYYQYSALCNSLELATIEVNRIELREQLHSVNKDYIFDAPDLTKLTFEFKKSKQLLAREAAKRAKKEAEDAEKAKLQTSIFNMAG